MADTKRVESWSEMVWRNGAEGQTPLSAENLNSMSRQISAITEWIVEEGALTFDQLVQQDGTPNEVELTFPSGVTSLQEYKVLFIKGWINKGEPNNYAFTCTLPVSNLTDYGMFNVIEYDEVLGQDGKFYGTITSLVIRYEDWRDPTLPSYYPVKHMLFCSARDGITETNIGTGIKEKVDKSKKQGAVGRWLHNLGDYERRDVYFQEVYGLR